MFDWLYPYKNSTASVSTSEVDDNEKDTGLASASSSSGITNISEEDLKKIQSLWVENDDLTINSTGGSPYVTITTTSPSTSNGTYRISTNPSTLGNYMWTSDTKEYISPKEAELEKRLEKMERFMKRVESVMPWARLEDEDEEDDKQV